MPKARMPRMCRDVVRVPPFGEHRHRHHAADLGAELARLANGVRYFAEQIRVGDVVRSVLVPGPFNDLATGSGRFHPQPSPGSPFRERRPPQVARNR